MGASSIAPVLGSYVYPSQETVRDYLERWLRDFVETKIEKPKTRQRYASIVRRHLIPAFGHLKLATLTPTTVQSYSTPALSSGRVDSQGKPLGKPLAQTTVAHHEAVLHEALEHAVK